MSTYHDYIELKNLFLGWRKAGVVMGQEVTRLYESELKRLERESRCRNAKGTRCMKKCRNCDKQRDGAWLSLDQMIEVGNLPQDIFSVEAVFEEKELSEALDVAIERLSNRDQLIVVLFANGYTEREIASIIGVCQKTVNNRKELIFAELRAYLKNHC